MAGMNSSLEQMTGFMRELVAITGEMAAAMKGLAALRDTTRALSDPKTEKSSKSFKDALKNLASAGVDKISGLADILMSFVDLGPVLEIIATIMAPLNALIKIFAGELMEQLMPVIQQLFEVLLSPEMIELTKLLAQIVAAFLVPALGLFVAVLKTFQPIIGPITDGIRWIANGIIWFINAIITGINMLMNFLTVGLWADIPAVPMLARGGIVNGPTLAMVGEAGPEKIIPLNPFDSGGGGGGGTVVHVHAGTLVASDGGIRELQKRMRRIL